MANDTAVRGGGGRFADLKRRLLFLLGALIVYRIGTHVPVPGIDPGKLTKKVTLTGIAATAGAKAAIEAAGGSVA